MDNLIKSPLNTIFYDVSIFNPYKMSTKDNSLLTSIYLCYDKREEVATHNIHNIQSRVQIGGLKKKKGRVNNICSRFSDLE